MFMLNKKNQLILLSRLVVLLMALIYLAFNLENDEKIPLSDKTKENIKLLKKYYPNAQLKIDQEEEYGINNIVITILQDGNVLIKLQEAVDNLNADALQNKIEKLVNDAIDFLELN